MPPPQFSLGPPPHVDDNTRLTVLALIHIVKSESAPDSVAKARALDALGAYQSDGAIPTLLNELTFGRRWKGGPQTSPINSFPAAKSLVRIGHPARDALLGELSLERTEFELEIMAHVFLEMDADAKVAAFRLWSEMDQAIWFPMRDDYREQKIANLRRIIQFLTEPGFKIKRLPPSPPQPAGDPALKLID